MFMSVSIDGYFEGPNHDISWHNVDSESNKFATEMLKKTDLFLWGRRIYQLMEAYWPGAAEDPSTSNDNREIAQLMNNTDKVVFSKTLERVEATKNWKVSKLVRKYDPNEIRRLKSLEGKEINVGGPDLAASFLRDGLIDELRFMVNPIAIGKGTPIFQGLEERMKLELIETRQFRSGNELLYYRPR